jgi:PAS domain S-box-containing protein
MAKEAILIVEDEAIVALNIANTVGVLGYVPVGPVATGNAALELLERQRVDLVLMDVRLKGAMDGIEAADRVRESFQIPVIYLTAYSDAKTLERAKLTGPYGYITKAFDDRELHSTIEMALYKHRMERALLAEEHLLATTLDNIADAVITVDDEGCIKFFNRTARELFRSDDESIEDTPFDAVGAFVDEKGSPIRISDGSPAAGLPGTSLATLVLRGGAHVPVEWSAVRVLLNGSQSTGTVIVIRDLTSRLKAEEAQARLVSMVESSDDAIISTSLSGEILSWNRGAEKMYGFPRSEMVGQALSKLLPDFLPDEISRLITRIKEGESSLTIETVHRNRSGSLIDVSMKAQGLQDYRHGAGAVSLIIRDITARKNLDKRLREIRNNEQARIGQDLHDSLGQQLAGILFNMKVLERRLRSLGVQEEAAYAARLADLIGDALHKTKDLARGLIPAKLQTEGLLYALQQLCSDVEGLYGISVECRVSEGTASYGHLVDTELYHIAEEAVGNASRHGGCTRISVLLTSNESELILSIDDDGDGIPEKESGSGLGMRIMQHRADLINGSLTVSSSQQGTLVICRVPIGRAGAGTAE